jgi:hypothetical protein
MTAQVVSITEGYVAEAYKIKKIVWSWTTDSANGAIVDSTTAGEVNKTTGYYTGVITRLITDPGSAAPTDNYDIVVLEAVGNLLLIGGGHNRHTTTTQQVLESSLGVCLNTQLRFNISTAGNSKNGVVILYIRVP